MCLTGVQNSGQVSAELSRRIGKLTVLVDAAVVTSAEDGDHGAREGASREGELTELAGGRFDARLIRTDG